MLQLPVASISHDVDTLSESFECARHVIARMLVVSQMVPRLQDKKALTADLELKVHELLSQDHFLPFHERTNFFERISIDVFDSNMLDTLNALQTGNADVVFKYVLEEYEKYVAERSSYWILHGACKQHYSGKQLKQLPPLDVSNFSENNWQQLVHMALTNDGIDALMFLNEMSPALNFNHALVAALNLEAQTCLDYIVPRVDIGSVNLASFLTVSGYSKNQKVFEYFCSKVFFDEHANVRLQLQLQTQANTDIIAWFDKTTAQQQRSRILNQVNDHKPSVARKM